MWDFKINIWERMGGLLPPPLLDEQPEQATPGLIWVNYLDYSLSKHVRLPLLLIVQECTWAKNCKTNRLLFATFLFSPLATQPRLAQVSSAFHEANGNVPCHGCPNNLSPWVLQQVVEIDDDDDELDAKTLQLGSPDPIEDFVLNVYLQAIF